MLAEMKQLADAHAIVALMLELLIAMIELSILPRPKEKDVEMERKGDLVCHQVLKEMKMKNNLIKQEKKQNILTSSLMCRGLTLRLKTLEITPGTDSSLRDRNQYRKEEDEKEPMLNGKKTGDLNKKELSHGF